MGTSAGMVETGKIPGDAGRVPLANGDAAALAPEAPGTSAPFSLRRRLLKAQEEVAILEKDATITGESKSGKAFSYKGISAAQVIARGKAMLIKHGIFYAGPEIHPETMKIDGNKLMIWITGRFENIDDPSDFIERGFWGTGTDNSDQACSKAYTNANKQIIAKVLQMTTVEDETDKEVPHEPEGTKAVLDKAKQDNDTALRAWADALKTALNKATSIEEIDDLQAGARETLMAVPQATRDYFVELIQRRKKLVGESNAA